MYGGENDVSFIETSELLSLLKARRSDVAIIDVRTDDFAGGHISGALNIPVDEFECDDTIDEILSTHITEKKEYIVFHCMFSQMRGPFCAKRYSAAKSRRCGSDDDCDNSLPQIKILRGGYKAWKALSNSLGQEESEGMIEH
eukprot:CAMPEP_0114484432 /NCGR_PEP_ID=MMETSP0104-20121206/19412_1 /TAXON_ID=37642 ORGANISM="Paraphysomonas imperforata, Strain PA2" /NCGR_SAMPLE_ID=MMETSP0104 /ASSEMBLY_ACC=CAM_ASM_000202 /LENGTH=141 /DNA_ID=CAMNT_0001660483 /DNA_START=1 /DNA_END=426 /DNA_ORIENTATION=+